MTPNHRRMSPQSGRGLVSNYVVFHLVLNRRFRQAALHAMQLCSVLTDTSQQQPYNPERNRGNNNKSDAWDSFLTRAAVAAHSRCSGVPLLTLNSCPLIYIPYPATSEIPGMFFSEMIAPLRPSSLICEL